VLITGGNKGIGLETAKSLFESGASVILASRDIKQSQTALREITSKKSLAEG
jgi:NAD(P)-dependent dehydrogenase (short-subunit alcohol dehydrogenase family)